MRLRKSIDPSATFELTSRQIVVLFVALVLAAVLAPIGVQAASNLTTIVGPNQTTEATGANVVGNRLSVGDGSGSLTVDGTVGARQVVPGTPWHFKVNLVYDDQGFVSGVSVPLFNAPTAGTRLYLTSVTLANRAKFGFVGKLSPFTRTDCGTPAANDGYTLPIRVGAYDMRHLDFPSPFVVSAPGTTAWSLCVYADHAVIDLDVVGVGYYA